ncbi:hypothetical protein GM418_15530 [Maribellus comscasis]|uniref:Peptidase S74 domain-containing protein n=1 Tax=Maribellus comscasis TaxID=2681766 RepID=A0A6I6JXZ2_9BACT|nr:tail fiber domain-containing protein [Maribellus comscasis]QGY45032.1 hypothetical protein GM418_15530 [Maribellus comscasis]
MKKYIALFALLNLVVLVVFSQVPNYFNYQAAVRNATGEIISNTNVSFRISILKDSESGSAVYVETHTVQTNEFGLVNLKIGDGTRVSGSFNPGNWGTNSHFIKIEMDAAGGSSYTEFGTSQLVAVPYAFHAKTVEEDNVDDADADPTNEVQTLSISGSDLSISDGNTITLPLGEGGDNWGTQMVVTDATLSGTGISTRPLSVVGDLTDDQTLSISGNELSISDGNSVTLPAGSESLWTKSGSNIYYNSGNIGIGTSNPNYPLDINGTLSYARLKASSDAALFIDRGDFGSFSTISFLNEGENKYWIGMAPNSDRFRISTLSNSLQGLEVDILGSVHFSENIFLTEGKNISIGVTNPYYPLEIKGGDIGCMKFFSSSSGTGTSDGFQVGLYSDNNATLNNHEDGDIVFGTNNITRMAISNDGHVSIGGNTHSDHLLNLFSYPSGPVYMSFQNYNAGTSSMDGFMIGTSSSNNAFLWNYENTSLNLGTNGRLRMTILNSGYVGIGTDTPDAGLHLKGTGYPASFMYIESSTGQDAGIRLYEGTEAKWHLFNNSAAGGLQIYNSDASTAIFAKQSNSYVGIRTTSPAYALHVNGDAAKTSGTTAWIISSDKRLKDIHGTYDKGLAAILELQPICYNYKKDNPRQLPSNKEQVGFVAQEVQKVFPEAVSQREDGYLDFNIHSINVAMVNAVKELNEENNQLKKQVENLENRLERMESLIGLSASK